MVGLTGTAASMDRSNDGSIMGVRPELFKRSNETMKETVIGGPHIRCLLDAAWR
jgi:hypothetical protein